MKEKEVLNKIDDVLNAFKNGDMNAICEIMFMNFHKIQGNLKKCLENYSTEQLAVMALFLDKNNETFAKKSKKEKVAILEEAIFQFIENELQSLSPDMLDELTKLLHDPKYQITSKALLGSGVVFAYMTDNNTIIYSIPSDVEKKLLEKLNDGLLLDATVNGIASLVLACHHIYGLVPVEAFWKLSQSKVTKDIDRKKLEEHLAKSFVKVNVKNQDYFWPIKAKVLEEAKLYTTTEISLSCNEINAYFFKLMNFMEEILNILSIEDTNAYIYVFYENLLMKPRGVQEIVDSLSAEFGLNLKKAEKLKEVLNTFSDIRYWSLGGKTLNEVKLDSFIIDKKPSQENLEECLSLLSCEAISSLYKKYEVQNISDLKEKIIVSFMQEDPNLYLLDAQNMELDFRKNDIRYILDGYCFVYKEKGKTRILVPREIYNNLSLKWNDTIDYVDAYMIFNGIIKKETLQEILQKHHNLHYTIRELDREILDHNYSIQDEYYMVMSDITEFEKTMILGERTSKDFKIVTHDNLEPIYLVDELEDELTELLSDNSMDDLSKKQFIGTVLILLHIGKYSLDILKDLLNENHFQISKNLLKEIDECVSLYKNDFPLWTSNGYTLKEINSRPKRKKIGRNDPCPCGSGKKYKQCCGK